MLKRLLIWVAILAIWEAAFRIIGWRDYIFPAPSKVVDSLLSLLNIQTAFGDKLSSHWPRLQPGAKWFLGATWKSELVVAILVSLVRLAVGFVISVILGATLGMAMWRFKSLDEFFGPLFLGLQTLPSVCWVPLGIIVFGLSESAIQFVLVMGSFFAIALGMRDGLRTIPTLYQRAGLMLGASGWRLYRFVLLPASLPSLASGLRQGFSFAWRSLMGAEFVFTLDRHGLGLVLGTARDLNDVGGVVGVMIVMVLIGVAADRLIFARVERRVHRRFGLVERS